jgi:hypothetical protein
MVMVMHGEDCVDQGQLDNEEPQRQRGVAVFKRRAAVLGLLIAPTEVPA